MKRIANKVAVATICYTISPKSYIRIVDYPSLWELQNDESAECEKGSVVFDDQYCGATYSDWKLFHAECHGVRAYHAPVTGLDILIFQICTAAEQY